MKRILSLVIFFFNSILGGNQEKHSDSSTTLSLYDFTMKSIDGEDISLADFKGKVIVVVNVASECGYTPHYADLQKIYEKYSDSGLVVLGFPANNFGEQEPGTDAEIKKFCTENYSVTFPMFSKISVRGADMHPLFQFITSGAGNPEFSRDIKWNFEKAVFDRKGKLVRRFGHRVNPSSEEFLKEIEKLLAK